MAHPDWEYRYDGWTPRSRLFLLVLPLAFAAAALLYFVLTFLTNRGLDVLERRYRLQM